MRANKKEIDEAIKNGKTVSGDFMYAKVSRISLEKPSFAIIVSKKVEKTSVGRHFVKRKISSILEKELLKMSSGFKKTAVIFAKKKEDKIDLVLAEKDLVHILGSSGFFAS